MWLCFVTAGCLADPLLVIPCSELVCGCVFISKNLNWEFSVIFKDFR